MKKITVIINGSNGVTYNCHKFFLYKKKIKKIVLYCNTTNVLFNASLCERTPLLKPCVFSFSSAASYFCGAL